MGYSPLGHLAFHYAELASKAGAHGGRLLYHEQPSEDDSRRARRMAEQLFKMEPDVQRQLFVLLRLKASTIPWRSIHPSWLTNLMKPWPVSWRLWTLGCLPPDVSSRVQKSSPTTMRVVGGRAPVWWSVWLSDHVRERFGYPDVSPWEKGLHESDLPGTLWETEDIDIVVILRAHGTFGLVSCLRKLARSEAQALMWQLPPDAQPIATEVVQSKKWVDDPFWTHVYEEMKASHPALKDRLLWMAWADWLRCATQDRQGPALRRLIYRLPRPLGSWALQQLETPPSWISMPIQQGVDEWKKQLKMLARDLHAKGQIRLDVAAGVSAQ